MASCPEELYPEASLIHDPGRPLKIARSECSRRRVRGTRVPSVAAPSARALTCYRTTDTSAVGNQGFSVPTATNAIASPPTRIDILESTTMATAYTRTRSSD